MLSTSIGSCLCRPRRKSLCSACLKLFSGCLVLIVIFLCVSNINRFAALNHQALVGFVDASFEGGRKCGKVQGRLLESMIDLSRDAAQRRQLVMKSSSIALSQRLTGPGTGSLQAATSQRAFHHAAFGHSLAVLSVAAAPGIKFILQRFNVGYPLSSSFLGRDRDLSERTGDFQRAESLTKNRRPL
jgi:hypothetical protein